MITKILAIISVILLFVISVLIFWLGLAPKSFLKFFEGYTLASQAAKQIGIITTQPGNLFLTATSSEPVLSKKGQVVIGENSWSVEIASNEADRFIGLSNRKTLYNKTGLLFTFDRMSTQSFWMKDMLIPIDMIFFDNNWQIVLIESNLQPKSFPEIYGNKVNSQYVLEINAGEAVSYGLKAGDTVIFLNK
jgi:uncharacterized membrane protein (UPF0127 family)